MPPAQPASSAAAALAALQATTLGRSNRPVVYTPPEMVPRWAPSYAQEVDGAAAAALDAGASPAAVYKLLDAVAARDLDGLPPHLLALCVDAGLSANADMSGETLLHFLLNDPQPVPLGDVQPWAPSTGSSRQQQAGAQEAAAGRDEQLLQLQQQLTRLRAAIPSQQQQRHPTAGATTLAELLRRGATPNLPDSAGNTALHMVAACMISKKHYPDPSVTSAQQQQQKKQQQEQEADDAPPPAAAADDAAGAGSSAPTAAQLQDNDAARAAYGSAAFVALLQAGWHPTVRNANGYTVTDLLLEGLARYQAELHELQDPEGVAQTTVALLSQQAPDKGLQQFLAAKTAGVQAVVNALLLMHTLAVATEAPRLARSAAVLVLAWLLLLALCCWCLLRGRWRA